MVSVLTKILKRENVLSVLTTIFKKFLTSIQLFLLVLHTHTNAFQVRKRDKAQ